MWIGNVCGYGIRIWIRGYADTPEFRAGTERRGGSRRGAAAAAAAVAARAMAATGGIINSSSGIISAFGLGVLETLQESQHYNPQI